MNVNNILEIKAKTEGKVYTPTWDTSWSNLTAEQAAALASQKDESKTKFDWGGLGQSLLSGFQNHQANKENGGMTNSGNYNAPYKEPKNNTWVWVVGGIAVVGVIGLVIYKMNKKK